MLLPRDAMLKIIDINGCGFVPSNIAIIQATWHKYRERLENILIKYPSIFKNFKKGSLKFDEFGVQRRGNVIVDDWGCVWAFNISGLDGQVIKHPLEDWSNIDNLNFPNPEKGIANAYGICTSWKNIEILVRLAKERGELAIAFFPHGFFFMRLHYLRGFTNLMKDFVLEPPKLHELIERLTEYNLELIERYLKLGVDVIAFGDDLGLQDRMPISEKIFRKFFFPSYYKMFQRARRGGARVYLHSDGHIMEVMDDLIEAGVSVINLQDRINGLDNIKRKIRGRVCIDLDIDRQNLLPFGTPKEIDAHTKNYIIELGSKNGGLMLTAGIYPDVPLENLDALCNAIEKYATLYETYDDYK